MKKRNPKKDLEIKFYEGLLSKRPDFVQALISLGDAYTRQGFYQEGLAVDQRLVALKPDDPIVNYNLACSLSLVGDVKACRDQLVRAVEFGYRDFAYILEDTDMENFRNDQGFGEFYSFLKQKAKQYDPKF
jgi:tetratricopeptide (TPR) repeat protein